MCDSMDSVKTQNTRNINTKMIAQKIKNKEARTPRSNYLKGELTKEILKAAGSRGNFGRKFSFLLCRISPSFEVLGSG